MHTRRNFLYSALLGAAGLGCRKQRDGKPNIVLIMADDLGYETLGCNGGTSYRTPVLDGLAGTGIRFTQAYAEPLCTPTRVQLMTGKYNFRNWRAFGILDPRERTFGHMMREAGYRTCISGKWQLYSYNPPDFMPEWRGRGMRPEDSGFDEYCLWHAGHTEDKGSRYADPVILQNGKYRQDTKGKYGPDLYTAYITDFIERNAGRRFFVYYPMALTHGPFNPTPHSPEWRTGNRLENNPRFFKDMVEYMDFTIGRIVNRLDTLGLRERTLILFYGDNGTPLQITSRMGDRVVRGGKGEMTDAGTHVPLIANWPGVTPPGEVLDDLVDSTDFYPTLAELAGADLAREGEIDGRSFAPRLRGEAGRPRQWVYCDHNPHPGWAKERFTEQRWARNARYKLYGDGRFYDVANDVLEQRPIPLGGLTPEVREVRGRLQAVLDRYPPIPTKPDTRP